MIWCKCNLSNLSLCMWVTSSKLTILSCLKSYLHIGKVLSILTTSLICLTFLGPEVAVLQRFHCTVNSH